MKQPLWNFTDRNGEFIFDNPERISRLYFPLANETEFMSSITPLLKGDIKTGQNQFLTQPVSSEDLYNNLSGRNFWIYINPQTVWSTNGVPPSTAPEESSTLKAGILWHSIQRKNTGIGLQVDTTNFVPSGGEHVELMTIRVTNISAQAISFTPTSAIPVFGRSADNLRDHRHVTSLLHRVRVAKNGIIVKPEMSFDERGHKINRHHYFVLGCTEHGNLPAGQFPTIESFIGEGGCLAAPRAVIDNFPPIQKTSPRHQGKEAIGALRFETTTLIPNESITYIFMYGITESPAVIGSIFKKFNSKEKIECALTETIDFWKTKTDAISFCTGEFVRDNWLRWVSLQPTLRKIFGCSFLPDFDYGRGGKGWRDLWQDCLTLLLAHPQQTRDILLANFSGIRIDGTNATIITKKPGYFIADRNKIARVWMDHGIWPFFTLLLYIHQTGDFDILFKKRTYFYDQQLSRSHETDPCWDARRRHCRQLHTKDGHIYQGTVLEHVLVQHLVQFFNVGKHNNIRLEGADWNDGLDMAAQKGESVAFTCFYAYNLYEITMLLLELKKTTAKKHITIAKELFILLDRLHRNPVQYNSVEEKTALMHRYFSTVKYRISGKKVEVDIDDIISDLSQKWQWIFEHVRKKEWIQYDTAAGFFNGYYNNKSQRVEGRVNGTARMTLTGQVFPILSGAASHKQIRQIFRAAQRFLRDKNLGGFRLNTDFKTIQPDLGRAFAFAYGEKENGAIFSHMCIMFAKALYQRNFVREGYAVLNSLFELAADSATSKIYPCLPEYFNAEGRGMYSYLTGSASWYIMTMLTEVFGVKGHFGDLVIGPKLTAEQFKESDTISLSCFFAERRISVIIKNPNKLDFEKYRIAKVTITPKPVPILKTAPRQIKILRRDLLSLGKNSHIMIEILLG